MTHPVGVQVRSARGGEIAAWLAVFIGTCGLVQLLLPTYFDSDTAYHLAVARLMRSEGLLSSFPWTPYSWLAEHYADKELLFHLLLLPVANLDPPTASRIAGTFLGTVVLTVLYLILRSEGVLQAGLWTLAAPACSGAFLARFAMVRPHLLSIALSLILVWSATRRRWVILATAAFLFPFCYTAWHLPLALATVVAGVQFLVDRRLHWRGPALVLAAVCTAVLLHPDFPENLRLFRIVNIEILFRTAWSSRSGFDLGGEFQPFSLPGFGRHALLPSLLALAALRRSWAVRREDALPLAAALCAAAFLAVTLRTQRFIEYLVPFSMLAAALTLTGSRLRSLPAGVLAVGVALMALLGRHPLDLMRQRTDLIPPPVREALAGLIPPGAQVVTCDWEFTGELLLALPGRRFLVALDPVLFAVQDPRRYRIWYQTTHDPPPRPARLLGTTFAAGYVLCAGEPKWGPFLKSMAEDPDTALRVRVGPWRIFQLRP